MRGILTPRPLHNTWKSFKQPFQICSLPPTWESDSQVELFGFLQNGFCSNACILQIWTRVTLKRNRLFKIKNNIPANGLSKNRVFYSPDSHNLRHIFHVKDCP